MTKCAIHGWSSYDSQSKCPLCISAERSAHTDAATEIASLRSQVASLTAEVEALEKELMPFLVEVGKYFGGQFNTNYSVEEMKMTVHELFAKMILEYRGCRVRLMTEVHELKARLRSSAADPARVERAAEAIFITKYKLEGVDEPDRAWKSDAQWDTDAESTLCEWERDEYRQAARAALAAADATEEKPC